MTQTAGEGKPIMRPADGMTSVCRSFLSSSPPSLTHHRPSQNIEITPTESKLQSHHATRSIRSPFSAAVFVEAARPRLRPIQTLVRPRFATLESYITSLIISVFQVYSSTCDRRNRYVYLLPSLRDGRIADSIGYGITQYGTMRMDSHFHIAEEERIRKNQQLMDAYGYKDNIDDLQKALEAYEVR